MGSIDSIDNRGALSKMTPSRALPLWQKLSGISTPRTQNAVILVTFGALACAAKLGNLSVCK